MLVTDIGESLFGDILVTVRHQPQVTNITVAGKSQEKWRIQQSPLLPTRISRNQRTARSENQPVQTSQIFAAGFGQWIPSYEFKQNMTSSMVACRNKLGIVTPLSVTKSDFTIGFSVVDLVENKVWFMDFLLNCRSFSSLKSKSRVQVWKFSKQLVG